MAAPILRHNREYFLILSKSFDSTSRCLSTLQKCLAKADTSAQRKQSTSPSGDVLQPIKIPDKIERSPTAILEALAKTVRGGLNKPLYQSIDDPALLSRSDALQRSHIAALDNGREAARAMIAMNPEYYTHFWDVPLPQTYDTVVTGYRHDVPSEQALLERIEKRKVSDAIEVYKEIKSQGEISQSTLEQFLELLCVFNHQDPEDVNELSNFVTPQFEMDSPFPVNTWGKGNLAEDVFQSLPEKSSKAYCSLICGIAENNDKEKALQLYREARAANVKVDVFTYNKLLSILSLDMESMDDIIQELKVVLKEMAATSVNPNVETFNALLKNCRRISRWRGVRQFALSVLSEMKACGIEPSLGTWVEILNIFYYHKDKSVRTPELFKDMLDLIEGKSYKCQGPRDIQFFRTAMRVISTHLPDSKLALRLHQILKTDGNFELIGYRQLRYAYFKELFLVISQVEHTDEVMSIYDSVVPYIFMPKLDVYKAIFENIETFNTYHYIPQLCADIDESNFYNDKGAIPLFQLMAIKKQEPELQKQFCDIASAFLQRWERSKMSRIPPHLDGGVLGDMIKIYLNGDQLENAQSALEMYRSNRKLQTSDPSDESLQALAEALMVSNDFASTKNLLTFMHGAGYENVTDLVTKALETFQLSDQESNNLKGLALDSSSGTSSDSDSD